MENNSEKFSKVSMFQNVVFVKEIFSFVTKTKNFPGCLNELPQSMQDMKHSHDKCTIAMATMLCKLRLLTHFPVKPNIFTKLLDGFLFKPFSH